MAERISIGFAIWSVCVLAWPASASAEIRASVDPSVVEEMESVRVTLRVEGSNKTENLDLTALERDFEVLGTNTSSQFRSINGQVQSWVEYHINLRPRRAGELEIPSLKIGNQQSRALTITVRALEQDVKEAIERMIFFETDITPNPVYVQAQTVLTRRLYYSSGVQIYSDLPDVPTITDAVVIAVGETATSTVVRDGQRYGVYEQRYAIFPEKSGELRIPEISVTSSVRLRTRGRTRRSGIRVSTDELVVDVKPIPAEYPIDQPWLSGKDVSLREIWEPTDPSFEVGEPVRRTLTVEVVGNTGSSIPPIAMQLPDLMFKQYPEPERLRDNNGDTEILGSREQTYSIIPIAPGVVTVPDLRLTWWDTVHERLRESVLPGRTVTVIGEPAVKPTTVAQSSLEVDSTPITTQPPSDSEAAYPLWLVSLTLFGFVGWFTTYLVTSRKRSKPSTSTATRPVAANVASNTLRALRAAVRNGEVGAMRAAFIAHLSAVWQTGPAETVRHIEQSADGHELMTALNRALYSDGERVEISGKQLLDTAAALSRATTAKDSNDLPELYPSSA